MVDVVHRLVHLFAHLLDVVELLPDEGDLVEDLGSTVGRGHRASHWVRLERYGERLSHRLETMMGKSQKFQTKGGGGGRKRTLLYNLQDFTESFQNGRCGEEGGAFPSCLRVSSSSLLKFTIGARFETKTPYCG